MRIIKTLSDEIRHNIHEAREKISHAYKMHTIDKSTADWYRDMAVAHLKFNDAGHNIVVHMIDDAKKNHTNNPMVPGMLAVYEEMHADIMAESAEVKAMIDSYK
jgi:hypothetical protein